MKYQRFSPLIDKLYWWMLVPTSLLMLGATAFSIYEPLALVIMLATDLFLVYFFISPLFGYVELREETVFIKFGFILSDEIPYSSIRKVEKVRKWYADSGISLKNSMEHVNIKYEKFKIVSVSVKDNDKFIEEIHSML